MSKGISLRVFGQDFPISNLKIQRLTGDNFEISGSFRGHHATYRRIDSIWFNDERVSIDPLLASFFDSVVERASKLALV